MDNNSLEISSAPQALILTRDDIKTILSEWNRRAVEGSWDKDTPFDADANADLFIEIAFKQ